jgi:hypothetical protein
MAQQESQLLQLLMDNSQKAEMLQPPAGSALHNFRSNHQNLLPHAH